MRTDCAFGPRRKAHHRKTRRGDVIDATPLFAITPTIILSPLAIENNTASFEVADHGPAK